MSLSFLNLYHFQISHAVESRRHFKAAYGFLSEKPSRIQFLVKWMAGSPEQILDSP